MILVILGTQDKKFERLLKAVDKQIKLGNIDDEVIVQAGFTKYESDKMKIFDLIPMNDFDTLVKKADLIITHGGVGSILNGIRNNKKVIAAPRLVKYGEHENDHQVQIVEEFVKEGYILECRNLNHLDKVLKEVKKFKPKKYQSDNSKMIHLLEEFIESTV